MIQHMRALFQKNKEILLYLVFGVLTTAVDWGITFLLYAAHLNVHLADVLAWIAAVLFAFVTNRRLVFQSKKQRPLDVCKELSGFAGGRVLTLLLQELIVLLLYDVLLWNPYVVKILAAVVVVALNYVISKFLIFKKK